VLAAAAALFLLLLVLGTVPRVLQHRELEAGVRTASAAPTVRVVNARRADSSGGLLLPGTVQALREASLNARGSGYVRAYHADIGARVRRGQLLAEIATPEVDQEQAQARAELEQMRANHALALASLRRWEAMARDSAATPQELDERQAAYRVAGANVAAAAANLRRLGELQGFGRVTAPFAGVVTARNVEVGQLVSPTPGARPLFVIAQADTARVMVSVPEAIAGQVAPGAAAEVLVRDQGGEPLAGRVVRTAGALDAVSRTMLTEVQVPNPSGALLPGMYAQVRLSARRVVPGLIIPANALLVRADGPQVAVVRDGRVHMTRVELGRDLGTEIEVLAGLEEGAAVVINPSDQVAEGAAVRVEAERVGVE
jgi:RND family efflux transporter MFP subunit